MEISVSDIRQWRSSILRALHILHGDPGFPTHQPRNRSGPVFQKITLGNLQRDPPQVLRQRFRHSAHCVYVQLLLHIHPQLLCDVHLFHAVRRASLFERPSVANPGGVEQVLQELLDVVGGSD